MDSRSDAEPDTSRDDRSPVGSGTGRPVQAGAKSALGYLAGALAIAAGGLGCIALANRAYAPEMYRDGYMAPVADALSMGENYAVFDLNLNIRELKSEIIKRLPRKPNLVVLGASQWQEASEDLLPNRGYFNAHVHRDYYEDMLGVTEMLVRQDRLPRHMVITIRDKLFTPVAKRKDFLWLPILPYYRAMAKRLSLEAHAYWETYPWQRPRELLSLPMLFDNVTRWHNATDWPYPTVAGKQEHLDLLRPDGSIRWSEKHQALFTRERARRMALEHAAASRDDPPAVDPAGVEAIDTLLSYLAVRGVKVHLAHPPFNPIFWSAVQGSRYMEGLKQIEEITVELAERHKLPIVGSFDPGALGCTSDMFIDAEHSQAPCLGRLLADVANSIDLPRVTPDPYVGAEVSKRDMRTRRMTISSGWMMAESVPMATVKARAMAVAVEGEARAAAVPELHPTTMPAPATGANGQPAEVVTLAAAGDRERELAGAVSPSMLPLPLPNPRREVLTAEHERSAAQIPEARRAEPLPPSSAHGKVHKRSKGTASLRPVPRHKVRHQARKATGEVAATATMVWPGDRPARLGMSFKSTKHNE